LTSLDDRPREPGAAGDWDARVERPWRPTWPRIAIVVGVLLVAYFVARPCQEEQLRVTEEQAIAIAEQEVEFEPTRTVIRFLRQGVNREPFWLVSLSIPVPGEDEIYRRLAVVRIDARTGEVEDVRGQTSALPDENGTQPGEGAEP
jgi:hypothetical protein